MARNFYTFMAGGDSNIAVNKFYLIVVINHTIINFFFLGSRSFRIAKTV